MGRKSYLNLTMPERPPAETKGNPAEEGQRKILIGGNWKCNGKISEVVGLVEMMNNAGPFPANVEVVVAPTFLHIGLCLAELRKDVAVGAQNCGINKTVGAFTGEISAGQLHDAGVTWIVLGHSERRQGFAMVGEGHEYCANKLKLALDEGLNVMFCIGEKKEERESGVTLDVCAAQLGPAVEKLSEEDWARVSIAYEPVWAIGTGLTATPAMAQETHAGIRQLMSDKVSPAVAQAIRIQYGGSMKGANAAELLAQPDIDGGLIGGASLKPDFINIINAAPEC